VAGNWSPFLPNGTDLDANFGASILAPSTITQDLAGLVLGGIDFNNANSYTISGPNGIAFDTSGSPSAPQPIIDVLQGAHTIAVPMTLDPGRSFVAGRAGGSPINNSAASLTFSGVIGGSTTAFTKTGQSTLVLTGGASNTFTGPTVVEQGTLHLAKTGGTAVAIPSESITVGSGTVGPTAATVVLAQPNALGAGVRIIVNGTGLLDGNAFFHTFNGAPNAITMTGGHINAGFFLGGDVTTNPSIEPATIDGVAINLTANRTFAITDGPAATDLLVHTPVEGPGGLIKTGSGRLDLTAANTYGGPTAVTGGGTLMLHRSFATTGAFSVLDNDSRAVLVSDGTSNKVLKVGQLNVFNGSRLDLTDNKLITTNGAGTATNGSYSLLHSVVAAAHNGGAWDGAGITTSMPDAATGLTSLGVSTGAAMGLDAGETMLFAGQTINASHTLVMYTYAGDANLDGIISGDDYAAIDFNIAIPSSSCWYNGDFNYDTIISGDDYAAIDFNIVAQGAPFPTGAGSASLTAVPEPAACLFSLIISIPTLAARRARR
jgi:autotransporter-associated beta strand protein